MPTYQVSQPILNAAKTTHKTALFCKYFWQYLELAGLSDMWPSEELVSKPLVIVLDRQKGADTGTWTLPQYILRSDRVIPRPCVGIFSVRHVTIIGRKEGRPLKTMLSWEILQRHIDMDKAIYTYIHVYYISMYGIHVYICIHNCSRYIYISSVCLCFEYICM